MCSSFRKAAAVAATALWLSAMGAAAEERVLTVCADPDDLPFSDAAGGGFEDRIAALIADDLGAKLQTMWRSARRGFLRRSLGSGACDLVMAALPGAPGALTTAPYYRSAFVVVSRRDAGVHIASYDDPDLRKLRIGVQAVGADGANTPPAEALARRGVHDLVIGFPPYAEAPGDDAQGRIIEAVAKGEIDVAFVWGPSAGYFVRRRGEALALAEAPSDNEMPELGFAYEIAVAVRKDEPLLRDKVDAILTRRKTEIARILDEYGVPLASRP